MKTYIAMILGLFPAIMLAQPYLSRQTIASSGQTTSASGATISQTVGETVTFEGSGGTVILSQGFQQPDGGGSVAIRDAEELMDLLVYPNPASQEINMAFDTRRKLSLSIDLVDQTGRKVRSMGHAVNVAGNTTLTMSLADLAAGHYVLILQDAKAGISETVKVRKID